ncbi:hypothetical protein PIB30_029129 [Stylosanthes scabra]|uniref:Uncharacterized protein n=1 Tax=Stylosanthes scabra TaxID=79078 RepID=A0ABU6W9Q8_9FABA|nr:hypothetical protein [Stylosanthes scabra]
MILHSPRLLNEEPKIVTVCNEVVKRLDLSNAHYLFDELIHRASEIPFLFWFPNPTGLFDADKKALEAQAMDGIIPFIH